MSKLFHCPFCGGEAETHEVGFPYHYWDVWCDGECFDHFCEKPTEAEAIAAWNSRAERTCECVAEYAKSPIDGKTIVLHRCSACHELMRPHMAYCPNCGAKVVDA